MSVTDIIALLGGFVGVVGVIVSALTAKNGATKAELESLRATITGLQGENERLRKRLADVECSAQEKDNKIKAQASEIETLQDQVGELRAQIDEMSKKRNAKARGV